MSKQVTISDVFYDNLERTLTALVEYAQSQKDEHAEYDYLCQARIYEYDTQVMEVIDRVRRALDE